MLASVVVASALVASAVRPTDSNVTARVPACSCRKRRPQTVGSTVQSVGAQPKIGAGTEKEGRPLGTKGSSSQGAGLSSQCVGPSSRWGESAGVLADSLVVPRTRIG